MTPTRHISFSSVPVRFVFAGLMLLAVWMGPAVGVVMAQASTESSSDASSHALIDDFESYEAGALPTKWRAQLNGKLVDLTERFVNEREWVEVKREGRNQFVQIYANGEAMHINMANGPDFDWDVREHPVLAWDWRAHELPEGSREDKESLNDSGAGMYVTFAMDGRFIKRPRIIKYVFSDALPNGTVVSYGKLKVMVVSSTVDGDGLGQWHRIERNVVEDHRQLFGGNPPSRPLGLRIWADADNTDSIARADIDNVRFLGED